MLQRSWRQERPGNYRLRRNYTYKFSVSQTASSYRHAAWRINVVLSVEKFAQARHYKWFGALRNLLLVMAQIAQLVLASVALLVVLQTCQAQQGYVGKVLRATASTLYYTLLHFLICACSVCYQLRSWQQSYRTSRTLSYTDYYQCWWSRCSRYGKFLT